MKVQLSYDLHGVTDSSVYKAVRDDIEKLYPQSVYILTTTYLIKTSDSIESIFQKIKKLLDKHAGGEQYHEFFFAEMTENRQGWLAKDKWERIKQIMNQVKLW